MRYHILIENGIIVLDGAEDTGALPGKALRQMLAKRFQPSAEAPIMIVSDF